MGIIVLNQHEYQEIFRILNVTIGYIYRQDRIWFLWDRRNCFSSITGI